MLVNTEVINNIYEFFMSQIVKKTYKKVTQTYKLYIWKKEGDFILNIYYGEMIGGISN